MTPLIIDEATSARSNIDFPAGPPGVELRFRRPELRTIIHLGDDRTPRLFRAFDDAPVIEVSAGFYPVEVVYAPLDELGSDAAADDEPTARAGGAPLH